MCDDGLLAIGSGMLDDTKYDNDWDDVDDSYDDENESVMVSCPYCREEMLEDAPQCPSCGKYISEEDSPPRTKPLWVLATIAICLIIALMWLVDF